MYGKTARTVVAGVDSSTQSCKIVICDAATGAIVRTGRAGHPAGTEVNPEAWWVALLAAIADAGGLADVSAISVGGQQHGMVVLDDDGRVIRDALLWNDTRSADAAAELIAELGADVLAESTGSRPVASFTSTKLRWLRDHEPDSAARVAAVALPHDWLTWRLLGYGPDAPLGPQLDKLTTDRSDASGTGYFDAVTNEWRREILIHALRLPAGGRADGPGSSAGSAVGNSGDRASQGGGPNVENSGDRASVVLPRAIAPGGVSGRTVSFPEFPTVGAAGAKRGAVESPEFSTGGGATGGGAQGGGAAGRGADASGTIPAGIVVGAGAGDNAAAAFGLGAVAGDIVVSIGTSGTVFAVTDTPTHDPSGTVAGFADASGRFLPLVATLNAARILHATANLLGVDHDELGRLALAADPGSAGLVLQPYFEGERTPNRPDATATLFGMTLASTTRENLARAAIEGLLCGLADGLDAITALGVQAQRILLIGGAALNPAVQAIAAQVFTVPVVVPAPAEYVALGMARQAAWALTGSQSTWTIATAATLEIDTRPMIREKYAERSTAG